MSYHDDLVPAPAPELAALLRQLLLAQAQQQQQPDVAMQPVAPAEGAAAQAAGGGGAAVAAAAAVQGAAEGQDGGAQQQRQRQQQQQAEVQAACLRRVAELFTQRPVWPAALVHERLAAAAGAAEPGREGGAPGGEAPEGEGGAAAAGGRGGARWRPVHVDVALARLTYKFKSGESVARCAVPLSARRLQWWGKAASERARVRACDCVRWAAGPWRGLHVRKGYDPRRDAGSWQHQAVHYVLPRTW